MKKRSLFFSTILIFSFMLFVSNSQSFAQQIAFTVLGAKGYVKVDTEKLKVGAKLSANQKVEIGENSYLSLATTDYRIIEVTQKGTYSVKQLLLKVPPKNSFNKAYGDFVINELTKANEDGISAKNRFRKMSKSGGVKRGGLVKMTIESIIEDETRYFYGDMLIFTWDLVENPAMPKLPVDSYSVEIEGIDGTSFFKKNVKESSITIRLSEVKNQGQSILLCKVKPLDSKGISLDKTLIDAIAIELLSKEEKEKIASELKSYEGNTALNKLLKARFFEEKQLYIDAIIAYEEAINLSENAEEYENMYYEFLLRNFKK